jgi:hypothetical protein
MSHDAASVGVGFAFERGQLVCVQVGLVEQRGFSAFHSGEITPCLPLFKLTGKRLD